MHEEIVKNCVVTLEYTVTDPDGVVVDDGRQPLVYLHGGYDGIFPKLEEALHGRKVGESIRLKLQPEEAFGDYDEELLAVENAEMFPEDAEIGMVFERVSDAGEVLYRVTEIADGKVVVDGNHPLAGMALIFDMTVTGVRAATEEELAHGHVHGEDGDDDDDPHHGPGKHLVH
ncbi:MAG: peptidylprolyl isomerase [Betaproteobacteria bacterium]|nr:peptidylprolyl isomerase [Betaproteobacteria bacterium]